MELRKSGYEKIILDIFEEESTKYDLKGLIGVAKFDSVYMELLPIQQKRLEKFCGDRFRELLEGGSFLSIAYAYSRHVIDTIAIRKGDNYDKKAWNIFAHEYPRLNDSLNATTKKITEAIDGIAIPATVPWHPEEITHVEDYYGLVISHRVIAEKAGIGWRGKNELIINPKFSCAIRLSSIITDISLELKGPYQGSCGNCNACLNVCTFLRDKEKLSNYREQCRRYLIFLGLDFEVCGKCIKACYKNSIYSDRFKL